MTEGTSEVVLLALRRLLQLFLYSLCVPRDLPSFPTRRSSDLSRRVSRRGHRRGAPDGPPGPAPRGAFPRALRAPRSEEHTSELQSHSELVCRLLLEKKNDC